jgi:hypothetical protein
LASLPAFFVVASRPSERTATPAESYPRYSSRRSPSRTTSNESFGPTYPTIPHIVPRVPAPGRPPGPFTRTGDRARSGHPPYG